jgi:cyclopropane fatty-acyl-phospholipid synthase-like methyltransferase
MTDTNTAPVERWNTWNASGGPKYPHEKVVQFCFRNYPPDVRPTISALDVGCGSGVHTAFLAAEGFQPAGVDIAETGVANARDRLERMGLSADLRVEGSDVLSFPDESFDLAICISVLECVGPEVARATVERVQQVLRPNGRALFLFASDRDFRVQGENALDLYGYTRDEVESIFNHGFSSLWIDRYITTYRGGESEQNDWLVTLEK